MSKKKSKEDIKDKIYNEEDFIHCPRLGNSLKKLIEKHPNGVEDDRIAKVLLISEDEVKSIFSRAIVKLRETIGLD